MSDDWRDRVDAVWTSADDTNEEATLTAIEDNFSPLAILLSSVFEISGNIVLVRMLSTLRAPLSTSVQRAATASTRASS